jgi:hexosaminidase
MDKNLVKEKDGQQVYGGYYTQDEMKEIIDYALEHKINILPEIDMPAHSGMAISIFPQLNCENKGPICPCNDFSYEFARNVFSEIIELFPYEYIHLGCDEVDRNSWANSYACKKFMKDKGISDVEQLQSFFTREMEKFFNSKGKKLIGWDEILEGGISKTATAMYWRTWIPNNLNNILKYGNNVIVASTSGYYLNYQQNNLSLKHTYEYQPVPTDIDSGKEKLICGIHASLWSEVIPNVKRLEYMAFPRVIAFSETAWTDENQRNWEDFLTRIHSHFKRLDALDVHYRLPDLTGFIENNLFVGEGFLVVNKPVEETEVRYTNDGSIPDRTSPVYKHPVKVKSPVTFNIGYFRPSGELYETYRAEFTKKEKYLASADISPEGSGLIRKYFKDNFNPENLKKKDISPSIALPEILDNQFGLIFSGYIKTKQSGIYTFYLTSHDGSILKIDDQIIVDNSGSHESIQKSGQAAMREGYHKFELPYWKTGYEVQLQLQFSFNGKSISEIENRMLFH